ncbi:hypothetical protein GCM10020254_48960 [Streptomyces goshikiensis]
MLDHLIKGATVVDGTGAAGYVADVGIRDGRIAVIAGPGTVTEGARTVEDATGLVLAPRVRRPPTPTTTPSCSGTRTPPPP